MMDAFYRPEHSLIKTYQNNLKLGTIAQSVVSLIADPGVVSTIPVRGHTFVEIDHEI